MINHRPVAFPCDFANFWKVVQAENCEINFLIWIMYQKIKWNLAHGNYVPEQTHAIHGMEKIAKCDSSQLYICKLIYC